MEVSLVNRTTNIVSQVLLIAALIAEPAVGRADSDIEKDVVYGMYSGLALLMDVRKPSDSNGYGILVIPGSGWEAPLGYSAEQLKHSYELEMIFGVEALVSAGYTVFAINHRATPRFEYPAPIEDAQRAVRYIRHHAADLGIDPDRIGAIGGSSGGHLVGLLGTLDGTGNPSDADPVNRHSAKVDIAVAMYAPTDFLALETTNPWAGGAITSLLGPVSPSWKPPSLLDSDALNIYRQASPITHVSADDPPFLLIHGDADDVVPFSQSERFVAALQKAGIEVELIRIPGGGHGPGLIQANSPDHVSEIVKWFDERRGNRKR